MGLNAIQIEVNKSDRWDLLATNQKMLLDSIAGTKVLNIGCGHSGTQYIAKVFTGAGWDVGHEEIRPDGISDSRLTPLIFPATSVRSYKILHQTRDPLATISSMHSLPDIFPRISLHLPTVNINKDDVTTVNCMKYYYYWNLLTEPKADLRYRVENIANRWQEICELIGLVPVPELPEVSKTTNIKVGRDKIDPRWKPIVKCSWAGLLSADESLTLKIIKLAKRYGYEVDEVV